MKISTLRAILKNIHDKKGDFEIELKPFMSNEVFKITAIMEPCNNNPYIEIQKVLK
jgi:hypothetical protein